VKHERVAPAAAQSLHRTREHGREVSRSPRVIPDWLPRGKHAAVCFSIDDVHPAKSSDYYEAGGDLDRGALGHVAWLLNRHPKLRITLFTTPDWREISPWPTRRMLQSIPYLRDRVYLAKVWPKGTMRVDRHLEFGRYLSQLPRTEIGLHGLHHIHVGTRIPIEFQDQDVAECKRILQDAIAIFESAGLGTVPGLTPPGFHAPAALLAAMPEVGLSFLASARDLFTPISADATANMTGMTGVSLIYPELIEKGRLVHIPTNFQATSPVDRAFEIVEHGGLVSIKAHIIKNCMGHIALDGMDLLYRNYLDVLFSTLEARYGDTLWWTSMGEIAETVLQHPRQPA
jgi:hypothetical protein